MSRIVDALPAGGPVAPEFVIGRRGAIEDRAFRAREGVSLALTGPRRVGKTTLGDAVCSELKSGMTVLPRVEVAEHRADASELLRAINAACERATRADEAKRLVRALRPALEALFGRAGLSTDLAELFADPASLSQRETLMLPVALAQATGRPVVLFLDELQRVYEFEDHGLAFLADFTDLYTRHREVVVLVDGSDERLLDELYTEAQLGKLLERHDIAARISQHEWRAALPNRFEQVGLQVAAPALEALIAFGAERPYETMWVSQRAALSALQSGTGELTGFDADQAIAAAHREL